MTDQVISLDAIMNAVRKKVTGDFDLVVGIERGGVLPSCLVSHWLNIPLSLIKIRFRDDNHQPIMDSPQLLKEPNENIANRSILLVDDVCNTGATLNLAVKELKDAAHIKTMVISGYADISLFGVHEKCLQWPWDVDKALGSSAVEI